MNRILDKKNFLKKAVFLSLVAALVFAVTGSFVNAAVTKEAITYLEDTATGDTTSTVSYSMTNGSSGQNRQLIVLVMASNRNDTPSLTYNSVSAGTPVLINATGVNGFQSYFIFVFDDDELPNDTSAHDMVVTFNGNTTGDGFFIREISGARQDYKASINTSSTYSTITTNDLVVTPAVANSDMFMFFGVYEGRDVNTEPTTLDLNSDTPATIFGRARAYSRTSAGTSEETYSWVIAANGINKSAVIEIESATDTTAPVISSVATSTTATTATITWTTNESASSTVNYGLTTGYGSASSSDSLVTSHSITLTGLTESTQYNFNVGSQDAAGNVATSTNYTFTTASSDSTPPEISSVATSTTATTATITWTTNEAASSTVNYGTTTSYGSASSSDSLVTSHSIVLTGLTANTTYNFNVGSQDAAGNVATSSNYTITTTNLGANEPGGFTAVVNRGFNTKASSDGDRGTGSFPDKTGGSEGWDGIEWNDTNFTITTDGTAPESASNVGKITYPVGLAAANAPVTIQSQGFNGVAHGFLKLDEMYVRTFIKLSPTYFVGGTSNKLYFHRTDRDVNRPEPFLALFDQSGDDTVFKLAANFQGTPDNGLGFFDATGSGLEITKDRWYQIETYLKMNSAYGVADGIFRAWLDDELVIERTNVQYRVDNDNLYWNQLHISPTYGGGPNPNDTEFYYLIDNAYVSGSEDTAGPVISSVASSTTNTTATITWTTDEYATSTVNYGLNTSYGSASSSSSYVTSHSITLTGLTEGTLYHFNVGSQDVGAGVVSTSTDYTFTTTSSADSTAPTVSVTAPTEGATVTGSTVTVSADASDNVGVSGVQFKLDTNTNIGSEDTSAPYSITWDSTGVADGAHTIIAVARDAAGNYATSTAINVTVDNSGPTVSVLSPADNATGVALDANLSIQFDEVFATSTGNIVLYDSGDSVIETFNVATTDRLSGYGTDTLTINPTSDLSYSTGYYVQIAGTAIDDQYGNSYAGISDTTSWSFTTVADSTAPSVSITSPSDGTTVSGASVALVATASDNVGVSGVQFKHSTNTLIGSEDTGSPYTGTFDSTGVSDGSYSIIAVARDAAGNYATSTAVSVTVDNTAPVRSAAGPSGEQAEGTTSVNLVITTNEAATCKYDTSADTAYGSMSGTFSTTGGTSHSTSISGLSDGNSYTYYVRCQDGQGNANSSDTTISFSVAADSTAPSFSSVSGVGGATSATVTWTTNEQSSSQVIYGPTTSFGATTTEADLSPRVTSHSVALSSLASCTKYYFRVISSDATSNQATSTTSSFTTTGCDASASISDSTSSTVDRTTGGSVTVSGSGYNAALTVPTSYYSSNLTVQLHQISKASVSSSLGIPSGKNSIPGSHAYQVTILDGVATPVTTLDEAVTVTVTYSDDDISGVDESTLSLYRWTGSAWSELSGCSVDTGANTVTCTSSSFSVIILAGTATESSTPSTSTTPGQFTPSRKAEVKAEIASNNPSYAAMVALVNQYRTVILTAQSLGITIPQSILDLLNVTPVQTPSSFTRDLQLGDTGEDVRTLQNFLVAQNIGPAAQALQRNGTTRYFGPLTRSALIEYQKANNISPAVGYFGPVTRGVVGR